MTFIADVLLEFLSPISQEKVWVMGENDGYTKIVRDWFAVKDIINIIKFDFQRMLNLSDWVFTNKMWTPTLAESRNTAVFKRYGYRYSVPSPPGTEGEDCKREGYAYIRALIKNKIAIAPRVHTPQTNELHTSAIGSFEIYTTIDKMNAEKKTATLNFSMFNLMNRRSFGTFASDPEFKLCGMANQYMWWNWTEDVDWSSGMMRTTRGWR